VDRNALNLPRNRRAAKNARAELSAAFTRIPFVITPPATDTTTDAALLARIRAGDAVALSTVYRRHSAAVFRFACLHTPSRDAAADATQETFLWLSTNGATGFDTTRSSLAAFLCGVARNHGLRIRALEARFTELPEDDHGGAYDGHAVIDDALAHLLSRERGVALLSALALLPAEHREVIALVEFEDFSYADAASIIGCPVGTVRSRLSRAKEALRERVLELFPTVQRMSA
jgi:RNA polymerase sigma-70 factor, ECF subfamily